MLYMYVLIIVAKDVISIHFQHRCSSVAEFRFVHVFHNIISRTMILINTVHWQ